MAKFNSKSSGTKTVNYMGHKAFTHDSKTELVLAVLSSFIDNSYYESNEERIKRLIDLVEKNEHVFTSKLAIYARKVFHMRSATHVLVGELARIHKGDSLVADTLVAISERPDDVTEVFAYYGNRYGKPIPNALKKGAARALQGFNQYQLTKYKGSNKDVKLKDLFNLVHPKGTPEQMDMWGKLLKDLLSAPDTWEVLISGAKNQEEARTRWEQLIMQDKLGYMAMLRNLRNFQKYKISKEALERVKNVLSDPERVRKSKQLPFRFLSAYKALEANDGNTLKFELDTSGDFNSTLNKALSHSVKNLPLMEGETVILSDNSGSMTGDVKGSLISAHSSVKTSDIANLFAVLYWTRCQNTLVGLFGDSLIVPALDRSKDIFDNFKVIDQEKNKCGAGTEQGIFELFEKLIAEEKQVARIIIFSDCQIGDGCKWYDTKGRRADSFNSLFQKYRKISPNTKVYVVDLKGYGTTVFSHGIYKLAGWSDKIFDLINITDKDPKALINDILNYGKVSTLGIANTDQNEQE